MPAALSSCRRMRRRTLAAVAATLGAGVARAQARPAGSSPVLTVYAAASLREAFEEVGRAWESQGGARLRFSFAASGTLARQIEQGATASLFASADEEWMDWLQKRGLIVADTRRSLLSNRLALVVPADRTASVTLAPGMDFPALLGPEGRWVTGDPASVPAGRYAQAALVRLGAWQAAALRLVRAENVRVALAFVERGEVAAGVVYETDARASKRVKVAALFPPDSHPPIRYPFAVVARQDSAAARDLLQFLDSPGARERWQRYGFGVTTP